MLNSNFLITEMDKMRRGASRFSRQINNNKQQSGGGHKLLSALEKSKKVRKLSVVNGKGSPSKEESEMGCSDSSDRENECFSNSRPIVSNGSSKRFKIPKKFFDDCNVVDHASVPRKLRSAMKKRNQDSVSPPSSDSKRLNHRLGGESLQKDGVNKHKQNLKQRDSQWSKESCVSGPITKDEEEVVETLYALAGMFPDHDTTDKNIVDGESLEGKPLPPPEAVETSSAPVEGKKKLGSVCLSEAAKVTPIEAVETNSLIGTSTELQSDLPDRKRFRMETDRSIPQASFNVSFSPFTKTGSSDKMPPSIQGNIRGLPELSLANETLSRKQEMITPTERKSGVAFGVAHEHMIKDDRKKGITLWPGLSSTVPLNTGSNGSSRSSTSKLPAWLDAAMSSSRPSSSQNGTSAIKISEVTAYRKPMKKCAAHVYISHLIQSLQRSEAKDSTEPEYVELRHQEGLKQAVVMPHYGFNKVRNVKNDSPSSISLGANRSPYDAGMTNHLQHKKLHQDRPLISQAPTLHSSHKQSYDFLSLSAGGGGETYDCSNKAANSVRNFSRHQAPYLHPLQPQPPMHFSSSQARSTSSAYSDQLSLAEASAKQGQMMLPPYLSSPFYGPYASHQGMAKQPQQLQQQQRLWAAQLAAHCRATGASTAVTQFPSWKNFKHESAAPVTGVHTVAPPFPSSLDTYGPKYSTGPQHQQPLMPISSTVSTTEVKRQDHHHLPYYVYEETGSGFRAGSAVPMQLLCNECL